MRSLLLAATLPALAVPALTQPVRAQPAQAQPAADTGWTVVETEDGARIGHGRREIVRRPDGRDISATTELLVREEGDPATRIVTRTLIREGADGRPVFLGEEVRVGRTWNRTDLSLAPGRGEFVRRSEAAGERRQSIALPADIRFDGGEGLLRGWDPATTPRLSFSALDLGAMSLDRVTIEAAPNDAQGRRIAIRRRFEGPWLRSVSRLVLAPEGGIAETHQPMFGTPVRIRPATSAEAREVRVPYRVLGRANVRAPYRISTTAAAGHIRYRFTFRDGIAFPFPETGEQRQRTGDDGLTVDICATCGPGLPTDPAQLARWRQPTAWLQSDDERLRTVAAPIAQAQLTDTQRMQRLTDFTRARISNVDFAGHVSAVDAYERRTGDCTETAVLLAALGRAAGIPTQVVGGLVYSRERYHGTTNVFLPHAWVVAWVDGAWRSFDAALDGFDATYIAITVGDGDARQISSGLQLAGLLRWEGMSEVRRRPTTEPSSGE